MYDIHINNTDKSPPGTHARGRLALTRLAEQLQKVDDARNTAEVHCIVPRVVQRAAQLLDLVADPTRIVSMAT